MAVAKETITDSSENNASTPSVEENIEETPQQSLPRGSVCEVKWLVQHGDKDAVEKDEYLLSLNRKPHSQNAIVTKQVFQNDELKKRTLEINSPHLLKALKEIVKYYPEESLEFETKASFKDPFKLLNHHAKDLAQYAENSSDADVKNHIELLLEFLVTEAGDKAIEERRLREAGLITFDLLWTVFKPGDIIFQQDHGHPRLYKLQKTGYGTGCDELDRLFELTLEYTSCDGKNVRKASITLKIREKSEFVGESPAKITELSLFPFSYLEDSEKDGMLEMLAERGERYMEIRGVQTYNYEGLFMFLKRPPFDHYDERALYDGIWLPRSGAGRVVVDCKTFVEEMRNRQENFIFEHAVGPDGIDELTKKSGPDPTFCPPFVFGYSLELKEWCKFFVGNLSPVEWAPEAMESLILPTNQRRLIKSLVTSHKYPEQARDEASLKGKGLIILLHGAPGSGKTLTAELVAEQTKRPLLKISTGELGAWGDLISMNLKQHLAYAAIWKAIVLIDEADVFLEERKDSQIEQNNYVAVFLKQLEYYQGILFLTSNRVGVFDRAIRSRIHLALQYEVPDKERRRLLWRQHIERLTDSRLDAALEGTLDKINESEMNGREISNSVTTAMTLANSEEKTLGPDHLDAVVQVWEDFQQALDKIERTSKDDAKNAHS